MQSSTITATFGLLTITALAAFASVDPAGSTGDAAARPALGALRTAPPENAQPAGPPTTLTLVADESCYGVGEDTVTVSIELTDASSVIVGGQFRLEYDNSVLDFVAADAGDAPFTLEIYEFVDELSGTIDYAVGVDFPMPGTMADTTMAVLTFDVLPGSELCSGAADLVAFRAAAPPTQLTDSMGAIISPVLEDLGAISIDQEAPSITCPPDVTVSCIEDAAPGILYGVANGGLAIHYNDNGGGENPANQAYYRSQFSQGNTNGGEYNFDTSPLTGNGLLSWYGLYQATPDQFGLDMVIEAPTTDGSVPTPTLTAYDNTNNSLPGAAAAGSVEWAINGYTGNTNGPADPANGIINSLIRGLAPGSGSVVVTRADLSLSGTVYTLDLEGYLESDGTHYWYGLGTPDSPMSNFNLNGFFFFSGTLTYDSAGDDGSDLVDFYSGTTTLVANAPSAAVGFATAIDNCTLFPVIGFSDTDNGGSGCAGDPLVITRTWSATDECGNVSQCVQQITVEDTTAPHFLSTPADITTDADAGDCSATLSAAEIGAPTAADDCDLLVDITFSRSDGAANIDDPFDSADSPITITWTATDDCGNSAQHVQTVTVNAVNDLEVAVELQNIDPTPLDRCITFVLHECGGGSETVEAVLTFTGGLAVDTIQIPCGDYDCITARDALHTLRRTDGEFGISGGAYVADFTSSGPTDDSLVGGNLNDDAFIDILDFGIFVGQFNANYGTPDTTCATAAPHADVSGDGFVDAADFTFIQINFFDVREANCCGLAGAVAGQPETWLGDQAGAFGDRRSGPVTRIAVSALHGMGIPEAAAGDLNRDGWLDVTDIAAFLGGAR